MAWNLITSAPARASSRTRAAHWSAPVQVLWPSSAAITSGRKPATSPWPPMVESGVAGDEHARARDQPLVDRALEREAGGAGRAEVAHGGEAGAQGGERVVGADQGQIIVGVDRLAPEGAARHAMRWTWASIRPGRTVRPERSISRAPGGRRVEARRRRAVMRPSTMVIVEGPLDRAATASAIRWPAWTTMVSARGRAPATSSRRRASRRASIGRIPR